VKLEQLDRKGHRVTQGRLGPKDHKVRLDQLGRKGRLDQLALMVLMVLTEVLTLPLRSEINLSP
jgi:hypothetical protein